MVLCLLLLLKYLLDADTKIMDILCKGGKYLFTGGVGSLLYFLMWKIILHITHLEAANYKGLTDYSKYKVSGVIKNVREAYAFAFRYYYTDEIWYNPPYKIIAYILLTAAFAIVLFSIIKNKKIYADKKKSAAIIIVLLLLPVGYGIIKILAPDISVSPLTIENMSLFILMIFLLFERVDYINNGINIMKWCTMLCSIIIIYNNILVCNIGYMNLQLQYEKSYAGMERVLNSIYDNGYSEEDYVIYIAGNILGNNGETTIPMQKGYLKGLELVESDVSIYNTMSAKATFINTYFGLNINYPDEFIDGGLLWLKCKRKLNYYRKSHIDLMRQI